MVSFYQFYLENHIELQGGDSDSNGNVFAVNRNGHFGPVCDDDWSNTDATTVCRQLGFDGGNSKTNSFYGTVPADFAMDNVGCSSADNVLQNCEYQDETAENCGSGEGAGVSCYYND